MLKAIRPPCMDILEPKPLEALRRSAAGRASEEAWMKWRRDSNQISENIALLWSMRSELCSNKLVLAIIFRGHVSGGNNL